MQRSAGMVVATVAAASAGLAPARADAWSWLPFGNGGAPPAGALYAWGAGFGRVPVPVAGAPSVTRVEVRDGVVAALGVDGAVYVARAGAPACAVQAGVRAPKDLAVRGGAAGGEAGAEIVVVGGDGSVGVVQGGEDGGWRPGEVLQGALRRARIVGVSCGARHCVAVGSGGEAYAWGANEHLQLGRGADVAAAAAGEELPPARVAVPPGVRLRAAACGDRHTVLLADDDRMYGCGDDRWAQLGVTARPWLDGGGAPRGAAVLAEEACADGLAVDAVACGEEHSVARVRDGGVWSWGANSAGALGHHNYTSFAPPNPIANWGLRAEKVAAGRMHTCVLRADGGVSCLGEGVAGQLGAGPLTRTLAWRAVKELTQAPGATAIAVSAGGDSSAAIVVGVQQEEGEKVATGSK